MTVLRQRMIEDMQLHGLAVRTQEAHVLVVSQLARHYCKVPDQIDEEELRQYFLYLMNVKGVSRSTQTIVLCGIKFFYERTLKRTWHALDIIRLPKTKKLPVVLSVEEVVSALACVRKQPSSEEFSWQGHWVLGAEEGQSLASWLNASYGVEVAWRWESFEMNVTRSGDFLDIELIEHFSWSNGSTSENIQYGLAQVSEDNSMAVGSIYLR